MAVWFYFLRRWSWMLEWLMLMMREKSVQSKGERLLFILLWFSFPCCF